eukprot:scaffold28221_cov59-Attheya_sp.AAC.1
MNGSNGLNQAVALLPINKKSASKTSSIHQEEIEVISQFNCETIRFLIDAMELGKEAKFSLYVSYLLTMPRGQLPEAW